MKCSFGVSDFLEEISSLSHSVVFLYFSELITEEGFLISSCYSLELCIQMPISFLFSCAFRFSSRGLNQIFYDYTVEVRNRFKGLDLIDRVPDELWMGVRDIVQETGIKTIPKKKKCKKAKWLSEEADRKSTRLNSSHTE